MELNDDWIEVDDALGGDWMEAVTSWVTIG